VIRLSFYFREKKNDFLGYLNEAIEKETHNVTTFLNLGEAPSCLALHIEYANKHLDEPYSETEIKQFTKTITVFGTRHV